MGPSKIEILCGTRQHPHGELGLCRRVCAPPNTRMQPTTGDGREM